MFGIRARTREIFQTVKAFSGLSFHGLDHFSCPAFWRCLWAEIRSSELGWVESQRWSPPHTHPSHKTFTFCHYTYGPVFLTLSRASSFHKELQMAFLLLILKTLSVNSGCHLTVLSVIPCIFSNVPIPHSVCLHFSTLYSKLSSEGCTLFKPTVVVFF